MHAPLTHGTRLGDVEIFEPIGDGGFGTVYRGRQLRLDREVAVKVLSPELLDIDPLAAERFAREVELVRSLEHPNIVRLYDHGRSDDGLVWMVMALVRGRSLAECVTDEGPMPLARVVPIVRQLLSALAVAHDAGVVHRDLKPHNIMLEAQVGIHRDHVTLLDFGIGKLLEQRAGHDLRATLTASGAMLGTPMYMAPEQLTADPVSAAADIYALGVVTLELLTGASPFVGDTVMEILHARSSSGVAVPPGLDPGAARFVRACTADDPARRPPDARACAALLEHTAAPGGQPTLDGFLTGNDTRDAWGDEDELELFDPGFALDPDSGQTVSTGAADDVEGAGHAREGRQAPPRALPGPPKSALPDATLETAPPQMELEPFVVTSVAEGPARRPVPKASRVRPAPAQRGYGRLLGFLLAVGIVGVLVVLALEAMEDAPETVESALDDSASRADPAAREPGESLAPAVPGARPAHVEPVLRPARRHVVQVPRDRPSEPARATSLHDDDDAAACQAGRFEVCVSLGRRLASAQGTGRDEPRAAALFERACDGGLASGCGNLAALMVEGRGVEYDPEGAASLASRACEQGHAASCFNLGSMYEAGMGVPESRREARRYFERACHQGFDAGCEAIGE